jgi:O-antigen ligase
MTTAARGISRPIRVSGASSASRTIGPLAASLLVCIAAAVIGITAGERGIIVIAGLLAGIAALAIAINPDRATLIVVAILYSNAAAIAVQRYDVPYFAGAAFPLLLVVPFAYHIVIRRQPIIITSGFPLMIGYFIVLILSTAFGMSADPDRALDTFFNFVVEGLLIYFFVTNAVRSLSDLRLVVWVLLIVAGVIGALSVHQQATGAFDDEYLGFAKVSQAAIGPDVFDEGGQPRLAGMIGEKNRYAQVMVVLLPLGMFRVWRERRLVLRLLAAAATTFIAFGAILTFSRGAALGFAITIALMVLLRYIKLSQLASLLIAGAVILSLQPTYLERILTLEALGGATGTQGSTQAEDSSIRKRANETIAALLVFADHPLLGVGRGLFPLYYGDYGDEVGIAFENEGRQAHNLYAGIAAETGIFGTIFFLGIFAVTLVDLERVRRRWRERAPEYADMAASFSLAVIAYLTTGLFLHLAYERYLWILLALAGSAAWLGLRHAGEPETDDGPSEPTARNGRPNGRPLNGRRRNGLARPALRPTTAGSGGLRP